MQRALDVNPTILAKVFFGFPCGTAATPLVVTDEIIPKFCAIVKVHPYRSNPSVISRSKH